MAEASQALPVLVQDSCCKGDTSCMSDAFTIQTSEPLGNCSIVTSGTSYRSHAFDRLSK